MEKRAAVPMSFSRPSLWENTDRTLVNKSYFTHLIGHTYIQIIMSVRLTIDKSSHIILLFIGG